MCPPLCGEERYEFHGNNSNPVNANEADITPNKDAFKVWKKWSVQLQGSGKYAERNVRKGNGIVVGPDELTLWISDEEGGIHFLARGDGDIETLFTPQPLQTENTISTASARNAREGYIYSKSSISFSESIAVYAVIDVGETVTSRVIALDHEGEFLWQTSVVGEAIGTPVISSSGQYIFLSHNSDHTKGTVTAFDAFANGTIVTQYSTAGPKPPTANAPYGPLTIQGSNGYDDVYFMESWYEGLHNNGWLHKATISPNTKPFFQFMYRLDFSSILKPVLGEGRRRLWLTGRKGTVIGWNEGDSFRKKPSWKTKMEWSFRNVSLPITAPPIPSLDGKILLLPSATNSFFGIDSVTGDAIWKDSTGDSPYISPPQISKDGRYVYTIQSRDGTVTAHDIKTGRRQWQFSCTDLTLDIQCQDTVEADFAVSPYGDLLYYVDIFGTVTALYVDDPKPTPSPTVSAMPSGNPTELPSAKPSSAPTNTPSLYHSESPSRLASVSPSDAPTVVPTIFPSDVPSIPPSEYPSLYHSIEPSYNPTLYHSSTPSAKPSISLQPSFHPTSVPSLSMEPSAAPTMTVSPSVTPTVVPTPFPSPVAYARAMEKSKMGARSTSEGWISCPSWLIVWTMSLCSVVWMLL